MANLWVNTVPEFVGTPFVVISQLQERVESQTTGYPLMRTTVQIECVAENASQSQALGVQIRTAFQAAPLYIQGSQALFILPAGNKISVTKLLGKGAGFAWMDVEIFDILWTRPPRPAGSPADS